MTGNDNIGPCKFEKVACDVYPKLDPTDPEWGKEYCYLKPGCMLGTDPQVTEPSLPADGTLTVDFDTSSFSGGNWKITAHPMRPSPSVVNDKTGMLVNWHRVYITQYQMHKSGCDLSADFTPGDNNQDPNRNRRVSVINPEIFETGESVRTSEPGMPFRAYADDDVFSSVWFPYTAGTDAAVVKACAGSRCSPTLLCGGRAFIATNLAWLLSDNIEDLALELGAPCDILWRNILCHEIGHQNDITTNADNWHPDIPNHMGLDHCVMHSSRNKASSDPEFRCTPNVCTHVYEARCNGVR